MISKYLLLMQFNSHFLLFVTNHPSDAHIGLMGMFIAHEFNHSFENWGSPYDGRGKLRNWWDEQSKKQFDQRAKCLVDAYIKNHARSMGTNPLHQNSFQRENGYDTGINFYSELWEWPGVQLDKSLANDYMHCEIQGESQKHFLKVYGDSM
jgi:hypothetical protein